MIIHVENTEVKSLNKQSSYHYHLLLHHVKAKFMSPNVSRVKIMNLRIYTPVEEVLHLKELSLQVAISGSRLEFDAKINGVELVYSHEDIYGWFKKIFTAGMKSSRKEIIIKAFRTMREKMIELHYSEFTQAFFRRIIVNFGISLRNIKLIPELDDQISSINISSLKCLLRQSDELRRLSYEDYTMNLILKDRCWSFEIITDTPLCWFMGQSFDYLNLDARKAYVRGSALYVENCVVKLSGSHDDLLNFHLNVNTLRTEYSQELTSFVLKSVESSKEYVDLFSQLNTAEDVKSDGKMKSLSIESLLSGITIDAKVVDVSCFFINRHDVCVYANISEISSIDSFNYVLDTFQVSMADFCKYDSVYDLAEISTTYIKTKTLQINLLVSHNHPQICLDFSETFDCSWNAHFLRHLLSLARDFHNFKTNIRAASGMTREKTSFIPHSLPIGLDIKKLRNISIKHADVNVDKLLLLINELSGENLFFYHYFN